MPAYVNPAPYPLAKIGLPNPFVPNDAITFKEPELGLPWASMVESHTGVAERAAKPVGIDIGDVAIGINIRASIGIVSRVELITMIVGACAPDSVTLLMYMLVTLLPPEV